MTAATRGRGAARTLCTTLVCLPLVACGADASRPAYSPQASRVLRSDVAQVRAAAERGHRLDTLDALNTLTRHVATAQARGWLPSARARRILHAADLVADDVAALPVPQDQDGQRPRGGDRQSAGSDRRADEKSGREQDRGALGGRSREIQSDGRDKPEGWEAHKGGDGEGDEDDD